LYPDRNEAATKVVGLSEIRRKDVTIEHYE